MNKTIILDDIYLKLFTSIGVTAGIYDHSKLPNNLDKCQLPEKYKSILADILVLFEDVKFYVEFNDVFDVSSMAGGNFGFFPDTLVEGLWNFFSPRNQRTHKVKESASDLSDELRSEHGISFFYLTEPIWPSVRDFHDIVKGRLNSNNDRKLYGRVLETWPIVPNYLLLKTGASGKISIEELQHYVGMYFTASLDEIIIDQKHRWPEIKRNDVAIENFCRLIGWVSYASWQVEQIIKEAESLTATCSLPVSAESGIEQDLSNKMPHQMMRLLITQLNEEGLIIPDVSDLKTTLKLRHSKEISDFRQALWGWFSEVKRGDFTESEKIRLEVIKSNNSIKRLGRYRKMNNLMLYLALPSVVVDTLMGLPISGTVLSFAGIGLKVSEIRNKKDIGWRLLLTRE